MSESHCRERLNRRLQTERTVAVRDIMRVIGSGNLTRDVEVRATPSGAQFATLRVAFNTRRPDGSGGWADKANYVDVEVSGAQADACARYLHKGSRVFIDGELEFQEWQDRSSGQKRSTLRVRAQTVTFEGGRAADGPGTSRPEALGPSAPIAPEDFGGGSGASDDDIPF
jgi:single-strand DNA-binding protein